MGLTNVVLNPPEESFGLPMAITYEQPNSGQNNSTPSFLRMSQVTISTECPIVQQYQDYLCHINITQLRGAFEVRKLGMCALPMALTDWSVMLFSYMTVSVGQTWIFDITHRKDLLFSSRA